MHIKILHVVGDSKFGGASLGILRLARFWQSLNWEVEVLATDPEFRRTAEDESVRVVNLNVIWRNVRPLRDLAGLWNLFRYLKRNRYTVVHTHTTKAGFVGRIAAALAGVPLVIHTAHGFAFHESSRPWKILFYSLLERIASVGCKRVITVSRFHKRWGQRLGIAATQKIIAIPNGIPPPSAPDHRAIVEIRSAWGADSDRIVLFTPSRLAPEKGLEDLVEAMALLVPRFGNKLLLVVAGEGVLRPSLERAVLDKGLGDHVRFLGFQNNITALLAASDIVVLPTWREGLSIALLEAMAQGSAIISTTIGSNREATDDGTAAILIPPMQPARLAAAIVQLVSDPLLRQTLRERAKELYRKRYTQERMLEGYHQLYLELIKELESAHPISAVLSSHDR